MASLVHELYVNEAIVNHIHRGMKALYKESLRLNGNDSIIVFQESLRKIKDLSQMNLEHDYDELMESVSDEDFIDRVFELTFRNVIKHYIEAEKGYVIEDIRDLPSSYLNMPRDNVRLLHLMTLECARGIYTEANLYCTKYSEVSLQNNYKKAKEIIRRCVIKAVRKRIDLNEIYDYYTRPKTPEQQIETDFHKYVSETQKDVPDRLNWQEEEDNVKEITYDPEEVIEEDEDDNSSYKSSEVTEDTEVEGPEGLEGPEGPEGHEGPEEPEGSEASEPRELNQDIKIIQELKEPNEEPEVPEEDEQTEEPEQAEQAEEPEVPEVPEEDEQAEEPDEPEEPEEPELQTVMKRFKNKELKDPNILNVTLLDKKVDLSGIINK